MARKSKGNKVDQKGSRGDNGGDKSKSRGRKGKNKKRGKKQMNDPTRGAEGIRKSMVRIFFSVHQTHLEGTGSLAQ